MEFGYLRIVTFCSMFYVVSAILRTKFEQEWVCPVDYGNVVAEISDVASVIVCSEECASLQACRSFLFDPENSRCKINGDEATSFPPTCSATVVYGGAVKGTSRQRWLFEPCSSDATCTAPASHCSSDTHVCTCVAGYSYLPRTDTCVAGCDKYGRQFLNQIPGCLAGFDDAMIPGISVDECKDLCIAETGFICRAVEFITLPSGCFLTSATLQLNPTANVDDEDNCSTYMRTCA